MGVLMSSIEVLKLMAVFTPPSWLQGGATNVAELFSATLADLRSKALHVSRRAHGEDGSNDNTATITTTTTTTMITRNDMTGNIDKDTDSINTIGMVASGPLHSIHHECAGVLISACIDVLEILARGAVLKAAASVARHHSKSSKGKAIVRAGSSCLSELTQSAVTRALSQAGALSRAIITGKGGALFFGCVGGGVGVRSDSGNNTVNGIHTNTVTYANAIRIVLYI